MMGGGRGVPPQRKFSVTGFFLIFPLAHIKGFLTIAHLCISQPGIITSCETPSYLRLNYHDPDNRHILIILPAVEFNIKFMYSHDGLMFLYIIVMYHEFSPVGYIDMKY